MAEMRSETVRVVNDSGSGDDRDVMLEPWGTPIVVPPGAVLEMNFMGPDGGIAEIVDMGVQVAVFGWPGSIVLARLNDVVVYDTSAMPTPPLPATMSMRTFITRMFGVRGS